MILVIRILCVTAKLILLLFVKKQKNEPNVPASLFFKRAICTVKLEKILLPNSRRKETG